MARTFGGWQDNDQNLIATCAVMQQVQCVRSQEHKQTIPWQSSESGQQFVLSKIVRIVGQSSQGWETPSLTANQIDWTRTNLLHEASSACERMQAHSLLPVIAARVYTCYIALN